MPEPKCKGNQQDDQRDYTYRVADRGEPLSELCASAFLGPWIRAQEAFGAVVGDVVHAFESETSRGDLDQPSRHGEHRGYIGPCDLDSIPVERGRGLAFTCLMVRSGLLISQEVNIDGIEGRAAGLFVEPDVEEGAAKQLPRPELAEMAPITGPDSVGLPAFPDVPDHVSSRNPAPGARSTSQRCRCDDDPSR